MFRVAFLVLAFACLLPAQMKVAIISSQQSVVDTAEIKKAQKELEAKFGPRQQQLEKLQKEVAEIAQQLQQGQGKLTPQAEQNLQIQGQRKQRELQRVTEDLQGEVDRERQEILARAGQRMRGVVEKLAAERNIDVVLDVNDAVYFKPSLDLTKEATAAYDKSFPPQ